MSKKTEQKSILETAQDLVHGDRRDAYGHPYPEFEKVGRVWGAVLGTEDIPPEKVALCMVGLKMVRECHKPKRDNRVDGAGYFETLDLCHQYKDGSK